MSLAERSVEQLVDLAAQCLVDRERIELELAGCSDTWADIADELASREVSDFGGLVVARAFELWLDDATAQEWQRAKYELQRTAQRLLDEMERRRQGGTDAEGSNT
jgi:hypothetical protein